MNTEIRDTTGNILRPGMYGYEEASGLKETKAQTSQRDTPRPASKFVNVWVCQGNYGSGWDDLTASPNYKEIRDDIRDYRNNEPNPHRLIRRRITRENFEAGNY